MEELTDIVKLSGYNQKTKDQTPYGLYKIKKKKNESSK